MAFSYRPLILDEVVSLLRYLANDPNFDLEEIPEVFSKFLRIGDPGLNAEMRAKNSSADHKAWSVQELEKAQEDADDDSAYNDSELPVKFRERSMRSFFRETAEKGSPFRWRPSEAHRQIFLVASKMAQPETEWKVGTANKTLHRYCAGWIFTHWKAIDLEAHSTQERAEVMEAFAAVLSGRTKLVDVLGGPDMNIFAASTKNIPNEKITNWAQGLDSEELKSHLSSEAIAWWTTSAKDVRSGRFGIPKGYLSLLYNATVLKDAFRYFRLVRASLEAVSQSLSNLPLLAC